MDPYDSATELDIAAARLAWVMLRFAQAGLPPAVKDVPELGGRLGDIAVKFFPRGETVALTHASAALLEFPKPVALTAMAARGLIGLWFQSSAPAADEVGLRKMAHAAEVGLRRFCTGLGLTADSRVLLEVEDEAHVFPVRVLARCIRDYQVFVGWVLNPLQGDRRADARLQLIRADGSFTR